MTTPDGNNAACSISPRGSFVDWESPHNEACAVTRTKIIHGLSSRKLLKPAVDHQLESSCATASRIVDNEGPP